MVSIHHNLPALRITRNLTSNSRAQNSAIEKLSIASANTGVTSPEQLDSYQTQLDKMNTALLLRGRIP